jgi:D-psicose/D-tagatose/L-ribulose 3-epimerase
MHFSLWGSSWTREIAEVAVPEAQRYGLQLIEIPLLTPELIDIPHATHLLGEHGIAASGSLCLPEDKMATNNQAGAEAFLIAALDAARALGCTFLGGVTYSALGFKSGKPPTEAEYDAIVTLLKPIARRAGDAGILLGIEPCNRYETHLVNTASHGLHLIDRIGEPNVVIHLDTYHMNIEEKGIGNGFRVAGKSAPYIHVSESDRGIPGTGTVDWDDAFAALAEVGGDRDLVLESFVTLPPEIAAALAVWRPVARDRFEILEQGVTYLKDRARAHGLIA